MKLDASLLQRAIPSGSMRYFAWLYTPQEYRDAMAALFLLETELRDTASAPHDVAHIRLQWWHEEIDRLTKDHALHPATQVLQAARRPSTDFSILHHVILNSAQDVAHSTYESEAELQQYLINHGALTRMAISLLAGSPSPSLLEAAEKLGAFIRNVETLRDIRIDIHQGHLYLPLNKLDKLNVEYEVLTSNNWPAGFSAWLRMRCEEILKQHQQLKSSLPADETRALRPLLVFAALHEKLLISLGTQPENFNQRLQLGSFTKLWTAWKTARKF